MTLTAVVILCISATVHAAWNFIGKKQSPSPTFFLLANTLGFLCLTPVVLTHTGLVGHFPERVWLFLVATGFFQAVYYSGLAGAYRNGDMSIAYPLARSMPVLMVAGANTLLRHGEPLTAQSIAGMVLIAVGGVILPMDPNTRLSARSFLRGSVLFAFMAAVGTTGYSIVDDTALRLLRSADGISGNRTAITLTYAFFEGVTSSSWLAIFTLTNRRGRAAYLDTVRNRAGNAALAGIGIFLAYSLVLLAMGFAGNVSYVVAFRQLSIPLGACMGVVLLREPCYRAKFVGVAAMLIGLVLVSIW